MDIDSFAQCLDSGKYEQRVKDNKKIATNAGARSTPSFVIVGPSGDAIPISGAQPYSVFQKVIEDFLV